MGVLLYHYTSMERFQHIRNSGQICPSSGFAGPGVYLTEIPPDAGRVMIAVNNYGALKNLTTARLACTEMCFVFMSDDVHASRVPTADGRNIWMTRRNIGIYRCLGCFFSTFVYTHCSLTSRNGLWYVTLGTITNSKNGLPQLSHFVFMDMPNYSVLMYV